MSEINRILIKLSGEFLAGKAGNGLEGKVLDNITAQISELVEKGVQVGIVVGGGNFFRGISGLRDGINRVDGDYMGMLATVMNAVALKNYFEKHGIKAHVLSAVKVEKITESLYPPQAVEYLKKGEVVIFAGGTGNPFFTTDTAGVLRAIEIEADLMLKATRVDGIYDSDPEKNPDAKRYETISYEEAIRKQLKIMDETAFSLARENGLKMVVFNLNQRNALKDIVLDGKKKGTEVK